MFSKDDNSADLTSFEQDAGDEGAANLMQKASARVLRALGMKQEAHLLGRVVAGQRL